MKSAAAAARSLSGIPSQRHHDEVHLPSLRKRQRCCCCPKRPRRKHCPPRPPPRLPGSSAGLRRGGRAAESRRLCINALVQARGILQRPEEQSRTCGCQSSSVEDQPQCPGLWHSSNPNARSSCVILAKCLPRIGVVSAPPQSPGGLWSVWMLCQSTLGQVSM